MHGSSIYVVACWFCVSSLWILSKAMDWHPRFAQIFFDSFLCFFLCTLQTGSGFLLIFDFGPKSPFCFYLLCFSAIAKGRCSFPQAAIRSLRLRSAASFTGAAWMLLIVNEKVYLGPHGARSNVARWRAHAISLQQFDNLRGKSWSSLEPAQC